MWTRPEDFLVRFLSQSVRTSEKKMFKSLNKKNKQWTGIIIVVVVAVCFNASYRRRRPHRCNTDTDIIAYLQKQICFFSKKKEKNTSWLQKYP